MVTSWKFSSILIPEDCSFHHCWLFRHWLFVHNRSHMMFAIPAMVSTRHQVESKQPQQHHQQQENPVTPKKKKTPKKKSSTPQPSSATKTKNLVTTTKPLKSPDLRSQSAKKTSAVLVGDNNSILSDTSSSSTRPGIPFFVQKQLAHDIEASGGINAFKKGNEHALAALCNKAPYVYGKCGDRLQEQL
jgi:outer membrane biosynthesis protein TonB